ncbi:aldo/keto reductase [Tersicoccus sp. MR15.9]|uniref:aldo/keto reductase n=1 Tax=Tersicoccus mangrovi TaxID=3121635 RepID=UPI002FE5A03F
MATRLRITPSQVGLAWQLAHAPVTMVIPGTASVAHLEENTAVSADLLDAEAMAALDAIGTSSATA